MLPIISFVKCYRKVTGCSYVAGLWIGIRLYFRSLTTQLAWSCTNFSSSCELVSDCIFVHWLHNQLVFIDLSDVVVNWYQIVFSFIDYTTLTLNRLSKLLLWIGIRLYFRSLTTQQIINYVAKLSSCELVSDCIFVHWLHNTAKVNTVWIKLWIGIRLYFRSLTTQQVRQKNSAGRCCELVSDCIFVHWLHNVYPFGLLCL